MKNKYFFWSCVLVVFGFALTGCDHNGENGNAGPSSMVELGIIGNSHQSMRISKLSRNVIGDVSTLELHIRGLYLHVDSGPNIPFIHDEGYATTHGGPTLWNAVTDPVGWYSFHDIPQIKWRGGTNHLQWYTEGLQDVFILVDNIRINGVEYLGDRQFRFNTPTNIPNIYAEELTMMNIFVEIPEALELSSSPDDLTFRTELTEKVVVSAAIY